MVIDVQQLLFGYSRGLLDRVVAVAGGFFLLLFVFHLVVVVLTRIVLSGKQRTLSRVFLLAWVSTAVLGVVGLSAWSGYANGGAVVALAVGIAPALAFVTAGTLTLALDIITTDHPPWLFLWYLFPGLVLGSLGFLLGIGIRTVAG